MRDLKLEAVELAYHNGARAGSAEVMEIDMIPLQYVSNNAVRAVVKAVCKRDISVPEMWITDDRR